MTPFQKVVLTVMIVGLVAAIIATGRAMYVHEKQKKDRGENL